MAIEHFLYMFTWVDINLCIRFSVRRKGIFMTIMLIHSVGIFADLRKSEFLTLQIQHDGN